MTPLIHLGINPFASVITIAAQLRSPIVISHPPPSLFLPETDKAGTALPARDTAERREGFFEQIVKPKESIRRAIRAVIAKIPLALSRHIAATFIERRA